MFLRLCSKCGAFACTVSDIDDWRVSEAVVACGTSHRERTCL